MNLYTIPFTLMDEIVVEAESQDDAPSQALDILEQEFFAGTIVIDEEEILFDGGLKQ